MHYSETRKDDGLASPKIPDPVETHTLSLEGVGPIRTAEEAEAHISIINAEIKGLSEQAQPLRKHLKKLYKRIAALNRQRHEIQVWMATPILTKKFRLRLASLTSAKVPSVVKEPGWHKKKREFGPVRNQADLARFIKTLDLDELSDFAAHVDLVEKKMKGASIET